MIRRFHAVSGRWADFSNDERYRYALGIPLGGREISRPLVVIGLNPSTATETQNDPTIRRCLGFARDLGADGLVMLNLYGWRSTDPAPLWSSDVTEPVGIENDDTIRRNLVDAHLVVAAWGAFPKALWRSLEVAEIVRRSGRTLLALGVTKHGQPRHPLYLPASARPTPWSPAP